MISIICDCLSTPPPPPYILKLHIDLHDFMSVLLNMSHTACWVWRPCCICRLFCRKYYLSVLCLSLLKLNLVLSTSHETWFSFLLKTAVPKPICGFVVHDSELEGLFWSSSWELALIKNLLPFLQKCLCLNYTMYSIWSKSAQFHSVASFAVVFLDTGPGSTVILAGVSRLLAQNLPVCLCWALCLYSFL